MVEVGFLRHYFFFLDVHFLAVQNPYFLLCKSEYFFFFFLFQGTVPSSFHMTLMAVPSQSVRELVTPGKLDWISWHLEVSESKHML